MSTRVALITGASSGIGKAIAQVFLAQGYIVYATARQPEALVGLEGVRPLTLDVTQEDSMLQAIQTITSEQASLDVLVNNAGFALNGPIEELSLTEVRDEFETNVFGLVRMTQLVLPIMRQNHSGHIINIGSIGGTFTAPGAGAYHASKYAVEAFTDALRYEVRSFGIKVTLIQPTGVHTPFFAKQAETLPQTGEDSPYAYFKQRFVQTANRMYAGQMYGLIEAEDVAKVVVHATQSERPRTRYKVGVSAHLYYHLRRLLTDRAWDWVMSLQFPMHA
jgi:NADP-dependent 3-hydroxy acid dehydrogenase YdfG